MSIARCSSEKFLFEENTNLWGLKHKWNVCSPPCKTHGLFQKRKWKDSKNQSLRRMGGNSVFPDMTGALWYSRMNSWLPRRDQVRHFSNMEEPEGHITPPLELLTIDGYWGKDGHFSSEIWPLLGGPYSRSYTQKYTGNTNWTEFKKKRENKVGKEWRWIWE